MLIGHNQNIDAIRAYLATRPMTASELAAETGLDIGNVRVILHASKNYSWRPLPDGQREWRLKGKQC